MKVKTAIKKRCKFCMVIRRRSKSGIMRRYVRCKSNKRHNQRQG